MIAWLKNRLWLCAQWLNITSTSILLSISSLVAKKESCRDRYIMLLFFTWPLWLVTALTSYQPVKFSKYRHHGENMFLIFHVVWCVHVIRRLCNFVDLIKFLAPSHIPPFSQVWWPQLSWKWRYKAFSLPDGLMYPRDQLVLWVVDKILSLESYLPVKFGSETQTLWKSKWNVRVTWVCWWCSSNLIQLPKLVTISLVEVEIYIRWEGG